jgi:putative SOS response-associated peptidase YedK
MCGRYVIISTPEAIRALFGYSEQPNFPPRYNVAPTQPIPIVRLVDGKRSFTLMRWGLLPYWVKDPKTFALLINARGESVLDKPAFRNAIRRRRCLIPTDGFYEWQASGGAARRPYFVRAKRDADGAAPPLAFAGLWETWTGPNGEELDTAAIVTTRANRTLAPLHDRMPVFVPPQAFDLWLDCAHVEADAAAALIAPADDALLEAYEVSRAVNRVANDSPELIAPVLAAAAPAVQSEPATAAAEKRPEQKRAKSTDDQLSLF